MIGTVNCVYEAPCGWCSKWDKKCDKKTPERGQREKCNLIDDATVNKMCKSECDHEWEIIRLPTAGGDCVCRKCGATTGPIYMIENVGKVWNNGEVRVDE